MDPPLYTFNAYDYRLDRGVRTITVHDHVYVKHHDKILPFNECNSRCKCRGPTNIYVKILNGQENDVIELANRYYFDLDGNRIYNWRRH